MSLATLGLFANAHRMQAMLEDGGRLPVLILHGTSDTLVPFAEAELMEAYLRNLGAQVRLAALRGGHNGLMKSELEYFTPLSEFLRRHCQGSKDVELTKYT